MDLGAHLLLLLLLATVLAPLLGTVPLRGWRWDRQCWWLLGLLSIGMPLAVSHRFARILLPGIGAMFSAVLLAGLDAVLRAERRGATAPALWWCRLARAFAGAGVWIALALAHAALTAQEERRNLDLPPHPGSLLSRLGFLIAEMIVVALVLALGWRAGCRSGERPSTVRASARRVWSVRLCRLPAAAVLLGLLAGALTLPWSKLQEVGVSALGYLGFDGFLGSIQLPDREVAKPVLASMAAVTLLLWGFQPLWDRVWKLGGRFLSDGTAADPNPAEADLTLAETPPHATRR